MTKESDFDYQAPPAYDATQPAQPAQSIQPSVPYPPQPTPIVYVQQPAPTRVVYVSRSFGAHPVQVDCTNCKANVLTKVKYHSGVMAWLIAGGCILVGCWMGCCLVPFMVKECKDADHYCPNCNALLGKYKRL